MEEIDRLEQEILNMRAANAARAIELVKWIDRAKNWQKEKKYYA